MATGSIKRDHFNDIEADFGQCPSQLGQPKHVQKHIRHATIIKKLVACLDVATNGCTNQSTHQPAPPQRMNDVVPKIVHVQNERATRPENPPRMG